MEKTGQPRQEHLLFIVFALPYHHPVIIRSSLTHTCTPLTVTVQRHLSRPSSGVFLHWMTDWLRVILCWFGTRISSKAKMKLERNFSSLHLVLAALMSPLLDADDCFLWLGESRAPFSTNGSWLDSSCCAQCTCGSLFHSHKHKKRQPFTVMILLSSRSGTSDNFRFCWKKRKKLRKTLRVFEEEMTCDDVRAV